MRMLYPYTYEHFASKSDEEKDLITAGKEPHGALKMRLEMNLTGITRMLEAGKTGVAIARAYRVPDHSIWKFFSEHGLGHKHKAPKPTIPRRPQQADILKKNQAAIVAMQLANPVSARTIADMYGVTRNAVIGWCRRNKIALGGGVGGYYPRGNTKLRETVRRHKEPSVRKPRLNGKKHGVEAPKLSGRESRNAVTLRSNKFPDPLDGVGVPYATSEPGQCQRPLWSDGASVGNVCGRPTQKRKSCCDECNDVLGIASAPRIVNEQKQERIRISASYG